MSDETSVTTEESLAADEDLAVSDPEMGEPVHSLTEPVDDSIRSSILDSVLHPDDDEAVGRKKLDRKFYEKELQEQKDIAEMERSVQDDDTAMAIAEMGKEGGGTARPRAGTIST